jgi:CheY-like chemotaxis protein
MQNNTVARWNGKKVLIVDNDIDNVDILTHLMQLHGVDVTAAESGRAALDALKDQVYFCVLTDLQMPEITGWDILSFVRNHENSAIRTIPIIAVTGHALLGDRSRIMQAGFDGYISKPINPAAFLETIQSIVDRSSP